MAQCSVIDVTAGGTACPHIPNTRLTQGCIHEHIRHVDVCALHAERLCAGQIVCRACLESSRPHHCNVLAQVTA